MESVVKVHPTVDECKTSTFVRCTVPSCTSVFHTDANLTLHLVKTHNQTQLWQTGVVKQYHCPEVKCVYHNSRFFKSLKLLRQHYLKVHTSKVFNCDKCKKSFSSDNQLRLHRDYCNVEFKCLDCSMFYGRYETLKTHSRRKQHRILEKPQYKLGRPVGKPQRKRADAAFRLILPKPPDPRANVVSDQSCQTLKTTMTMASQSTQQTQTGKSEQFTVETQTTSVVSPRETPDQRKSIKTQTTEVSSKHQSSNTSFNLDDFQFIMVETLSSGTQTTGSTNTNFIYSSAGTQAELQAETSDLLGGVVDDEAGTFDASFFNTMETQTDDDQLMLQTDLFNYCDYYSNMYTQTCDDIFGLGFNDIETQTAVDDILRSVEIQTVMCHAGRRNAVGDGANMDMETQTELEFQQMLEEIHS